jgi:hypothetical protein
VTTTLGLVRTSGLIVYVKMKRTKRTTRTGTMIKWRTKTSVMRTKWLKRTECKKEIQNKSNK